MLIFFLFLLIPHQNLSLKMEATAIANEKEIGVTENKLSSEMALVFTFLFAAIATLAAGLFLFSISDTGDFNVTTNDVTHRLIKRACTHSPNPPSCSSATSSLLLLPPHHPSRHQSSLHHVIGVAINHTISLVVHAKSNIKDSIPLSKLSFQEHNALRDCVELMDQTYYELSESIANLKASDSSVSYGNLKTLLSAAMTNENTCIDGFDDLNESDSRVRVREFLQIELAPISRMISNSLAIIKYIETEKPVDRKIRRSRVEFPTWMSNRERRMMNWYQIRPHLVVAKDGSGHCRSIGEAIQMAPSFSNTRFLIKIKAGMYQENVVIPREKINIMLVGDGMQSTVIASSRSFVDGFSTFTSATLTVVGDRFLARDITIVNNAGPEKHQAVALRATSTSAFFRCNISSYQDTLYAHSLRQFYRECIIEGTIDFIFGNAAAVFQNCLILVRKPMRGQRNMITAQGRADPNQNTGISMQNCTIAAAPDFSFQDSRIFKTYLGRPWRNHSRTIIMDSYIGDLVHPQGWCKWNKYSNLDTVEYVEYNNFGPGSDTRRRVRWRGFKKNFDLDMLRKFSVRAFLHGSDDWLETTGLPFFHGP